MTNEATPISPYAEKRSGELLKELARATPQTAKIMGNDGTRSAYANALESSGLSRRTAHRYEALANVPHDELCAGSLTLANVPAIAFYAAGAIIAIMFDPADPPELKPELASCTATIERLI